MATTISAFERRYKLKEAIGSGGMAIVYRAEERMYDGHVRSVAIKFIKPGFADDPLYRERFLRETHAVRDLDHPNVIPVYDADMLDDGRLYVVMRFVPEGDLEHWVARSGPMAWRDAVSVATQAAAGLRAAHQRPRPMLHRDVKPLNLLIDTSSDRLHVYVSDFGIVKLLGAAPLTRTDGGRGTAHYAAPEQLAGEPIDATADVYALGRTVAHLLTGRAPAPYRQLSVEQLPCPRSVRSVLARATAHDAAERYGDMDEFSRALRAIVEPQLPHRAPRWMRALSTRTGRPAGVALAVASLVGGLTVGPASPHATGPGILNAALRIPYPDEWHVIRAPAIEGMDTSSAAALATDGATLVVDPVIHAAATPDPAPPVMRKALDLRSAPRPESLGTFQALVYRGRTGAGSRRTAFFVPTDSGWIVAACVGRAGAGSDAVSDCERLVASSSISHRNAQPVGPERKYGQQLGSTLKEAYRTRYKVAAALRARSLTTRESAALHVARGYGKALATIGEARPILRDGGLDQRVRAVLAAEERAFRRLANAAHARSAAQWAPAARAVHAADEKWDGLDRRLRAAGYAIAPARR
jgi:hypothetical protein